MITDVPRELLGGIRVAIEAEIFWYGHSFILIDCGGVRIAIDPHDGASLNLPVHRVSADYLLITHNHFDHNAVEVVDLPSKNNIIKWKTGLYNLKHNIKVNGVKYAHDKLGGKLRGFTISYTIDCNGLIITHLGDIGTTEISLTRRPDILMIPVGGVYTVDAEEAWNIIEKVSPKIVIPLHYWVPYSTVPLDPLDKFLAISKARRLRLDSNNLSVRKETIPEKTTIVIFPVPASES